MMHCFLLLVRRIFVQIIKHICPAVSAEELGIITCYDELLSYFLLERWIGYQRIICRSVHAWVGACRKMSGGCLEIFPPIHHPPRTSLIILEMVWKRQCLLTLFKADRSGGGWEENVGRNSVGSDRRKCGKNCSDQIDFSRWCFLLCENKKAMSSRFRPAKM